MRLIGKYDIIHKIITAWDPMNLICYTDATCTKILNADEYDSEVDDIFDRIDYVVKLDETTDEITPLKAVAAGEAVALVVELEAAQIEEQEGVLDVS